MPTKLYYNDMSPPVRAVLMTAKALGIQLDLEEINIYNKEEINEELLQINPQHTVPTLVDEDFVSCDSYAILKYLVEKYGQDDSLYPKDPGQRDLVEEKLHLDSDTLYPRINSVIHSIVVENEKEIQTENISAITETYKLLDTFLENKTYLIGDCLTVADLACVATISTATVITPISTEKYPNLSSWYRTCKNLPYYEETNGVGLNKLDALVELKLGRPRTTELCE